MTISQATDLRIDQDTGMDIEAIRQFLDEHPQGIRVRMIDGTEYRIPHRDYMALGPPRNLAGGGRGRSATSFIVYDISDDLRLRLVNSLLVADVSPLNRNGAGPHRGRKKKSR